MTYLNLFEKLEILYNTVMDYKAILLFIAAIVILTVLYILKKLNNKTYTKGIVASLVLALIISFISNPKVLLNILDSFMTVFFKNIYFPSVYVYLGIIVILLVSTLVVHINKNTRKAYKIINSSVFITNSVLFVLILNIVAKNNINVFSIKSLYTNIPLVVTLELSTGLFLLWIGALLIAYTTNLIGDRLSNKEIIVDVPTLKEMHEESNILNGMETNKEYINLEEEAELPKFKQPDSALPKLRRQEDTPIFNYFNKAINNSEDIEIFSVDKYNLKLTKA